MGRLEVVDSNGPVKRLNELEYVNGEIYANIFKSSRIARISPQTGQVVGWVDLAGILGQHKPESPRAFLNGIAFDATDARLFVTGKLWPRLYEIKLIPKEEEAAILRSGI